MKTARLATNLDRLKQPKGNAGVVLKLSGADLRHEWVLTLCLIAAITAVLSPLLILFGLKYGLISIYTSSLIQNPVNREIRPMSSQSYSKEWFEQIAARPDVAFVIPNTRQLSAQVTASIKGKNKKEKLDLIPTAANDPLLCENGAGVPSKNQCVLSKLAAEELDAQIGNSLLLSVSRIIDGDYEYEQLELEITGILSIRASGLQSLYVDISVLEAVERYKDGAAVPEYGWKGVTPKAYPQYDGLLVIVPEKLDEIVKQSLAVNTGFTSISEVPLNELQGYLGYSVTGEPSAYLLSTLNKPVGEQSIKNVKRKLAGKAASFSPYVKPLRGQLISKSGEELLTIEALAYSAETFANSTQEFDIPPAVDTDSDNTADLLTVLIPSPPAALSDGLFLSLETQNGQLVFPVTVVVNPTRSEGVSFINHRLAGLVNLANTREISFDPHEQDFVLARRGYASFRLYAHSIYEVEKLRQFFLSQSLTVHSAAQEINKVIQLTTYLNLVFWLIAAVGVLGAVASLIASLYASVERKKREMGVLRLIGLSGAALFRFPVYQGVIIGVGGLVVALVLFQTFAAIINSLFKPHVEQLLGFSLSALKVEQNLCQIPLDHLAIVLIGAILISSLSALAASLRVTGIEAAEALRDE